MHRSDILRVSRERLAAVIARSQTPHFSPLDVSPWIAMSMLQKGIRRGREDLALRAAATLLQHSRDRLWRRCGGIAFEDIGVADLEIVSIVTTALAGKRFRATVGGEWPVASFIVSMMARATKCRAADDLLMSADLHPACERARRSLAVKSMADLLDVTTGCAPIHDKALALWYATGSRPGASRHLSPRRGEPQVAFDALGKAGFDRTVVEIAREGFRKIHEPLCPFVSLLQPVLQRESASVTDDRFPPEIAIHGVPCWAYDMYSHEGRAAFQTFLQGASDTARWVRAHIAPAQRIRFLGGIVFRIEGGLVRRRLRWPTANELRDLVDLGSHGPQCSDATEILQLTRNDIDLLNEVRANVC